MVAPEADPEAGERAAAGEPARDPRGERRAPLPRRGTFRIGSVLARAFSILGRNVLPFVVISLTVHLPLFAYLSYGGDLRTFDPETGGSLSRILLSPQGVLAWAWIPTSLVVSGPLAYGVVEQLRGRRPSIAACIVAGLRSLPRVLGVGIAIVAMFVAVCLGLFFFMFALSFSGAGLGGLFLGYLLLIGLVFICSAVVCRHAVAVTAAVVERASPGLALFRSRLLTRSNAWRVFGLWFLVFLMQWGVSTVLLQVTGGVYGSRPRFALLVEALTSAVLWTPLLSVALAVCYHDLRVSAEGVDADDLARVFE